MGTKLLVDTCYLHVAKGFITLAIFWLQSRGCSEQRKFWNLCFLVNSGGCGVDRVFQEACVEEKRSEENGLSGVLVFKRQAATSRLKEWELGTCVVSGKP